MAESKPDPAAVDSAMGSTDTLPAVAIEGARYEKVLLNEYVRRTAQGEEEALAILYDETNRLVYGLALRILGEPADAEEVTLDVYTQVWRNARGFDPQRGNVTAWLVMLTRSRAIDRLRSGAGRKEREEPLEWLPDLPASAESPEQASVSSQQRRWVRAALAELSPEQREAIELAFFGGLSHGELAARLGQPLGTVKTRIRSGMMKLREVLGVSTKAVGKVS